MWRHTPQSPASYGLAGTHQTVGNVRPNNLSRAVGMSRPGRHTPGSAVRNQPYVWLIYVYVYRNQPCISTTYAYVVLMKLTVRYQFVSAVAVRLSYHYWSVADNMTSFDNNTIAELYMRRVWCGLFCIHVYTFVEQFCITLNELLNRTLKGSIKGNSSPSTWVLNWDSHIVARVK